MTDQKLQWRTPEQAVIDSLEREVSDLRKVTPVTPAPSDLVVSVPELIGRLSYIRTRLYAAQAQVSPGDDVIITRHVYDAYRAVADLIRTIQQHGCLLIEKEKQ